MKKVNQYCPLPHFLNQKSKVFCIKDECKLYTNDITASDCNCLAYPKYHFRHIENPSMPMAEMFQPRIYGYTGKDED